MVRSRKGPRALLLDLDGVLVDTLPVMRTAWAAACQEHGIDLPFAAYKQHLGRPFDDIMSLLDLPNGNDLHESYDRAACAAADQAKTFEGIEAVLHTFAEQGWLLGVVTSKPLRRAMPLLARLGTPFSTIRTPGRSRGKPAPDPLLLAVLDLGLDPEQATYVGDMAVDGESARRAGVGYVHAAWGYGLPGLPLPAVAHAPRDLLALLRVRDEQPAAAGRGTQ
ncbi:HAD family hydrolase [Streptacidiphilus sp. 4-A2]|jgi:phosphoglycolate phosphatase-like HAD superfamily hydrolase|nr:HAD family hydrolase [Streptacidiphilus sp. 4-A2]